MSRALGSVGLLGLAEQLMHSSVWTAVSVACFLVALLSGKLLPAALGQAQASMVHTVALTGTFVLSGLPQLVESLCIAGSGKVDTHVLMALAAMGTVFMGMAQEVGQRSTWL